jgi:hypothetical protein
MHGRLDNFILGGATGLVGLVTILCIAYYFNQGSMQQLADRLMP